MSIFFWFITFHCYDSNNCGTTHTVEGDLLKNNKGASAAHSSSAGSDQKHIFRFVVQFIWITSSYISGSLLWILHLLQDLKVFTAPAVWHCPSRKDGTVCDSGVRVSSRCWLKSFPSSRCHIYKNAHRDTHKHTQLRRLLWFFCSRHSAGWKDLFISVSLFLPKSASSRLVKSPETLVLLYVIHCSGFRSSSFGAATLRVPLSHPGATFQHL